MAIDGQCVLKICRIAALIESKTIYIVHVINFISKLELVKM